MAKMRTEGLNYLKETEFLYMKCSCLGCCNGAKQES